MLEGIERVQSRIQQIEANIQAKVQAPSTSFSQVLQQTQGAMAGASFTPALAGQPGVPGMQPYLQNMNPALWNLINNPNQTSSAVTSLSGTVLEKVASNMDGKQYWPNACAHAVNDVLTQLGIDIKDKVNNNTEWVPNYADLGQKVGKVDEMQPGDLVIYNNEIGQGGYDHIGIYAGNGEAWNVSTAAGYKWVKTPIGSRFQEGRRITGS